MGRLLKKRRNDAAKNDHESGERSPGDRRGKPGLSSGGSQHVHPPRPAWGTLALVVLDFGTGESLRVSRIERAKQLAEITASERPVTSQDHRRSS